jgi:hypothetical protein
MENNDYDQFTMSVRDALGLILTTGILTLAIVGGILALAL